MSEMVERAARAIWETWPNRAMSPWDQRHDIFKDETRKEARNALLAALDDEDDALLSALADAPTFGKLDVIDAKIIIGLIKAHAQGETVAPVEVREK